MQLDILSKLLQVLLFNFVGGTGRLTPDAMWLLSSLLGVELTLAGMRFYFRREIDAWALTWKGVTAAIFGYLITNWGTLTQLLVRTFIQAGIKAGGDAIQVTDFTNPDRLAAYGFDVTAVLFRDIGQVSALSPKSVVIAYLSGMVGLGVIIIYFAMAVVIFVSLLEFYAFTPVAVFLLPAAIFGALSTLAEKAIAHMFAGAIRLMCLALVTSTVLPAMITIKVDTYAAPGSLTSALLLLLMASTLGSLAFVTHRGVQGFLGGSPALTPQDLTMPVRQMTHSMTRLGTVLENTAHTLANLIPERREAR